MSIYSTSRAFSIRNKLASSLIAASVVLLVVAGWLWWTKVYNSPYRVFWGALESSLATSGVTRHISQKDTSAELEQSIRLALGQTNIAYGTTVIAQQGEQGEAKVVTESIGTPGTDYIRYTDIKTLETNAAGQALDFSKLLGVWGKSEPVSEGQESPATYFNESLLGIVPFANLPIERRVSLLNLIKEKNVFEPAYDTVEKRNEGGRTLYTYTVKINPQAYIFMLQQLMKDVGVGDVPGLDPTLYEGAQALELQIEIDPRARQFTKVAYPGSGREERYTDYGIKPDIATPTDTIPVGELQTQLQNMQ